LAEHSEAPLGSDPQESVAEALDRAARHGRAAAAEASAAARALLDAASLAASGKPADQGHLAAMVEVLHGAERWLEPDPTRDGALFESVLEALDVEIARWETRSREEPEARAVLRAFLAVREVLWEIGRGARSSAAASEPERGGLRRVPVEG